ncbi:MAG: nickel-dependent lactate racemase [Bacillota bacterium]|nr:nickel-dependent lactate racemase [Bacillota bacterium]
MKVNLAYGKSQKFIEIADDCRITEVFANKINRLQTDQTGLVNDSLQHPINTENLTAIIRKKNAKNVVIVVNDMTRPTPYKTILPPLFEQLKKAGISKEDITLLVALGIHRPHTKEDNLSIFGEEICNQYRIENHNCDENLVSLGKLTNGAELIINRTAAEADLLITTGMVGLHYFAGYSGGRKSVMPGIAARSLIEANHKMMNDERAHLGNYENNPVSDFMIEAARKAGVDFILNVVTTGHQEIAYCAAGDLYDAWVDAVKFCEEMNVVPLDEKVDIVIASCGGYPKDINMYQAQKAIDSAALAVKDGGTIILVAECSEGLGEATFEKWIYEASTQEDIINRFHNAFELGGHKAFAICRTLRKAEILLVSELQEKDVRAMFLKPVENLQDALNQAIKKHGSNASIMIMSEAPKIAVKIQK